MTHQHLSLQSLHSLKGNAHDDDDGGTTDGQVGNAGHVLTSDQGQQSHNAQIQSAEDDDLIDDLLDEVSGGLAGTEAGDEAAVLLQVVGDLHRIILNGGVEPAEEEDHQTVHHGVHPALGAEQIVIPPVLAGSIDTHESADGSRQAADGLRKDHRHNAGHAHLNRGLTAAADIHDAVCTAVQGQRAVGNGELRCACASSR